MSSQLQNPAALSLKSLQYHWVEGWMGLRTHLDITGMWLCSAPHSTSTPTVQTTAPHCTYWNIPTHSANGKILKIMWRNLQLHNVQLDKHKYFNKQHGKKTHDQWGVLPGKTGNGKCTVTYHVKDEIQNSSATTKQDTNQCSERIKCKVQVAFEDTPHRIQYRHECLHILLCKC